MSRNALPKVAVYRLPQWTILKWGKTHKNNIPNKCYWIRWTYVHYFGPRGLQFDYYYYAKWTTAERKVKWTTVAWSYNIDIRSASLNMDSSGETFIIKICFHLKLDLDEDLDDFCEVTYEEKTSERLRIFLEYPSCCMSLVNNLATYQCVSFNSSNSK